jgi:hypothetical protein
MHEMAGDAMIRELREGCDNFVYGGIRIVISDPRFEQVAKNVKGIGMRRFLRRKILE